MSLSIASGPQILTAFSEGLDLLVNTPEESVKVLEIMKNFLSGTVVDSVPESLATRFSKLKELFENPSLEVRINEVAMQALQKKMKVILKGKIEKLICQPLTEIPVHRIHSFLSTVKGFYQKALSEGKSPKEALPFAVAKGLVRAMVKLPSGLELEDGKGITKGVNKSLKADLSEAEFQAYEDSIYFGLVMPDAVRAYDKDGKSFELYRKSTIDVMDPDMKEDGKFSEGKDPQRREGMSVRPDYEVREFLDNKVLPLVYPELDSGVSLVPELERLHDKNFMWALSFAYPVIKEEYEKALKELPDLYTREIATEGDLESLKIESENLMAKVGIFAKRAVQIVLFFVESVGSEVEKIPFQSLPFIGRLLAKALENSTCENARKVKEKYLRDLDHLIAVYREVESLSIPSFAKNKVLKEAVELIISGVSLEEINSRIGVYLKKWEVSAVNREIIKTRFPKCLLGSEAWKILGVDLEEDLLPDDILEILEAVAGKVVLLFIPEFVNGEPLTVNRLGSLMKGQLHNSSNGYGFLTPRVAEKSKEWKAGSSRWVLMTTKILSGSTNMTYKDQETMVHNLDRDSGGKSIYKVPDLLSALVGPYLYYAAFQEKLFIDRYTRVQEQVVDDNHHVILGVFSSTGLNVYNFFSSVLLYDIIDVAAQREFLRSSALGSGS